MKFLAQELQLPGQSGPIFGPLNNTLFGADGREITINDIFSRAVPFVFAFAGVGLLIMLVLGGFDFLTSAGDAKQLEQGKQRITYAIIGFIIIFVAFWLVQVVGRIFGLSSINLIFK